MFALKMPVGTVFLMRQHIGFFLKSIFNKDQSLYLGDKEAIAWSKIPIFLNMFPEGKVIITLRDPRDIVSSFKKITIAPKTTI